MMMNFPEDELHQEIAHLEQTVQAIDAETIKIEHQSPATAATSEAANLIQDNLQKRLEELSDLRPKPYFGRIDFESPAEEEVRAIYIGFGHIDDVYNWEAPIARLYYRPGDGRYFVNGQEKQVRVKLKRELIIEESRLRAISDLLRLAAPIRQESLPARTDGTPNPQVISGNSALTKSLEATGQRELQEIVATIQPEQYSLIEEADCKVMIVQGAAGSGKSEIGLHRLAFLLSPVNGLPEGERPQADRVLMIGPSAAFLNYVKNLLPSLGTQPIVQSTLRDWMLQQFSQRIRLGQENRLLRDLMSNQSKLGDREWEAERFKGSLDMKRVIDRYVHQIQQPYPNFAEEYLRMVESNVTLRDKGVVAERPFTDTDLAPLLYLDSQFNGPVRSVYEHIVIDEAQDVSPLEVHLLQMYSRNGWFTILGDLRQRLTPYRGVANWQEMRRVFASGDSQRFDARHSYRSTAQITKLGNRILRRLPEQAEPPIPHDREGDPPKLHRSTTVREMYEAIVARVQEGLATDQTVAVFTRTSQDAQDAFRHLLAAGINEGSLLRTNSIISTNLTVCPILLSKGLEFDLVVIAGVDAKSFTGSRMDNRLLYLACTRARHALEIHWTGTPSPLILDLGAVGMEVAGQLDTKKGKRGVFDRFRGTFTFRGPSS